MTEVRITPTEMAACLLLDSGQRNKLEANMDEIIAEIRDEIIAGQERNLAEQVATMVLRKEIIDRLVTIGLLSSENNKFNIRWGIRVKVTVGQLPLLRSVFDFVKDSGEYELASAEEETVKVYLDVGYQNSGVYIYYIAPLSAYSKCSIVRESKIDTALVCNR